MEVIAAVQVSNSIRPVRQNDCILAGNQSRVPARQAAALNAVFPQSTGKAWPHALCTMSSSSCKPPAMR
jgi:hypothetical protein